MSPEEENDIIERFIDRWLERDKAGWRFAKMKDICPKCGMLKLLFFHKEFGWACTICASEYTVQHDAIERREIG